MQLIEPSVKLKEQYLQALKEAANETDETQLNKPKEGQAFEQFVQMLRDYAVGKNLPEGWVPDTTLWLVTGEELIGRVSIRHHLTQSLLQKGGHIGYYIRPGKRNRGYGKNILALALPIARSIGLTKVLITCDEDNLASIKIIEANGGILENIIEIKKGQPKTRRYWILL